MLGALEGPACLCALDGAILAANGAWREALGPGRRPPAHWNLYPAFSAARTLGRGETAARLGDVNQTVTVAKVAERLFLVRTHAAAAPPLPKQPSRPPP